MILCTLLAGVLWPAPQDDQALTTAMLEVVVDTCLPCHHPLAEDKKAVRDWPDALDLHATIEEFVTPGDAEDSLLFLIVDDGDMPPPDWHGVEGKGIVLLPAQQAALADWIAEGAPLPNAQTLERARARGRDVLARYSPSPKPDTQEDSALTPLSSGVESAPTAKVDSPEAAPTPKTRTFWSRLTRLIGHSHSALVHFPIAFLYGAALAELLLLLGWGSLQSLVPARRFCIVLAAVSAIPAAVVGWIAADSVRPELTLTQHRWLGVTCAVLCLACLFASNQRQGKAADHPWHRRARILIFLTAVIIAITGHLGGVLTFGEAYFRF